MILVFWLKNWKDFGFTHWRGLSVSWYSLAIAPIKCDSKNVFSRAHTFPSRNEEKLAVIDVLSKYRNGIQSASNCQS